MLVIPSVSIGNVPQLALDLIIHTYGFEFVKSLDDESLSPFIGPRDYAQGGKIVPGISTAAELFQLGNHYLVQLRSPSLPGKKSEFLKSLAAELPKTIKNEDVLIAGSANVGMSQNIDDKNSPRIQEINSPTSLPDSGYVNEALGAFEGSSALISWVYEGDNIHDSIIMARELSKRLDLNVSEPLKQPVSWSRVYGKDIPLGIEQGLYT